MELMLSINPPSIRLSAVGIAGVFASIALCLSFFLLFQHLTNYNDPKEQKWLIGVIFMVPVYTVSSFLSLWNPDISMECDILRNCYEAFALYSFGNYLIECLGGERQTVEFLERQGSSGAHTPLLKGKATIRHPFPLQFLIRPWSLGIDFFKVTKFGIVQYMIVKTFSAFLAMLLELFGVYGDGEFRWYYGYPYLTVILNFSQTWALYCLVQFYTITHEELAPIKPLAKFVCFKAIVFATWWQGVGIALFVSPGFTSGHPPGSVKFQSSLQNFIICVEMAIAAVAHVRVFPASTYQSVRTQNRVGNSVPSNFLPVESLLDEGKTQEEKESGLEQLFHSDIDNVGTSLKESVQDVVFKGGGHVSALIAFS
eukprot:c26353_g1_i1 orf=213-1319(-)